MRRRGRHVALRRPRNFADRHRRVTRHRAGVSLSLLWPPLLNEKTKKVHSPFSTSAHVFYVHMPKAFAEHCSINKWNEEIWENSHILNKRLIHVAVFPGGTAKYTPEQQALRAGFVVLNTKWSTDRHIKAAKKRHAKKPAEAARMKERLASAVAQRKITDGCLRSGVAKVLTVGPGGHADVRPLRAGESGAAAAIARCKALHSAYEHRWKRGADLKPFYPPEATYTPPIYDAWKAKCDAEACVVEEDEEVEEDDSYNEEQPDEAALDADVQEAMEQLDGEDS